MRTSGQSGYTATRTNIAGSVVTCRFARHGEKYHMLQNRIVRVKLKKSYQQQRPISYVGKCTAFSENWVGLEAVGLMVSRQQPSGVQFDKRPSLVVVPRDSIESVVVLPDNFDWQNMKATTEGQQICIVVDGKRDVFVGEMGEG